MAAANKPEGEYSTLEGSILEHLYDNPDAEFGTLSLIGALKPSRPADLPPGDEERTKQVQQDFDAFQYAVETLIANRVVTGKRVKHAGRVQFVQLELTQKGMAEAIKQKRSPVFVLRSILNRADEESESKD